MNILRDIVVSTITGSVLWLLLTAVRPLTQRWFSAHWRYYTGLLTVFFFLNGAVLFRPMIRYAGEKISVHKTETAFVLAMQSPSAPLDPTGFSIGESFEKLAPYVLLFWLVGVLLFFVYKAGGYLAFRKGILKAGAVLPHSCGRTKLFRSSRVTTPFLMGVLKPVIVLPDFNINEREFRLILSHEILHYRRGDQLLKFVMLIVSGLHWFNPLAHRLVKEMDQLCEASCDEQLTRDMSREERVFYCETILSMLEGGITQRAALYSGFCSPKKQIERRLKNIMTHEKKRIPAIILSVFIALAVFGVGGTMAYAMSGNTDEPAAQESPEPTVNQIEDQIVPDESFVPTETPEVPDVEFESEDRTVQWSWSDQWSITCNTEDGDSIVTLLSSEDVERIIDAAQNGERQEIILEDGSTVIVTVHADNDALSVTFVEDTSNG